MDNNSGNNLKSPVASRNNIGRLHEIEDDSNSQSEDKSPITPIHYNHANN